MNFKRSAPLAAGVLASLVWRLCCPSPFCHGNSADDIVFLGWVWYRVFTHTQPLKEMSAGLYRRWWQTPWRVPPKRCREINEFLKDALSAAFSPCVPPSSSNILWTCFSSYHLLSCGFLPLPPTSRSLLPPLPSSWHISTCLVSNLNAPLIFIWLQSNNLPEIDFILMITIFGLNRSSCTFWHLLI